jgi:phospholipid/cholesterol/gamma-HCH transport system substrate-binding protein
MSTRPVPLLLRRATVALLTAALLAVSTACDFDGAYDLPLPGGVEVGDRAFQVTAEFSDVLNLVPKSEVRVDDVAVGEVTDVRREGWHAAVTMVLQRDVRLPDNTVAEIRQTSLLGEKYVALVPAPGVPHGRLSAGDHLPLASTGRNPEVEEVLGALGLLLRSGGLAQLQTINHELNRLMSGRQERIGDFMQRLDTLIGSLDRQRGQIVRALHGLDRLTRTLNAERETVGSALDTMGPALRVLADQRHQLVRMLDGLSRLGRVGTRVVNRTSADTLASLRHLQPILTRLAEAGRSLPYGLEVLVSFPFPREAKDVILGDYANTAAYINLDIAQLYRNYRKSGGPGPRLPDLGRLPRLPGLPGPAGPVLPTPTLPAPTLPAPQTPRLQDLSRPCARPGDAWRCPPRDGDPLDGAPQGTVGDEGGLLSGGLG